MESPTRRAHRASLLSWTTFLIVLLLFVTVVLTVRPSDAGRTRHRAKAAEYQGRQIKKGVPGPPPTSRAEWRNAPWAGSLRDWDHATFQRINSGWNNPVFDRLMPVVTHMGDGLTLTLGMFGYLFWAIYRRRTECRHAALMGLIGVTVGALAPLLKFVVPRYRPATLYPYDIVLLVQPLYGGSFPSGHTFTVFCVATILTRCHHWVAPWAFGLAALVGLSRILVGVHWPLDVIGGAALGIIAGCLVTSVWARRHRAVTALEPIRLEPPEEETLARAA